MQHSPVRPTAKGPEQTFTGDVYVTPIAAPVDGSRLTAARVRFAPGARSHWHSHDGGQTLHGVDGVGLVVNRGGQVLLIRAGETVWTPPGEEHWHGALPDTLMAHDALLDVNEDGSDPTRWLEAVPDAQYAAAAAAHPS